MINLHLATLVSARGSVSIGRNCCPMPLLALALFTAPIFILSRGMFCKNWLSVRRFFSIETNYAGLVCEYLGLSRFSEFGKRSPPFNHCVQRIRVKRHYVINSSFIFCTQRVQAIKRAGKCHVLRTIRIYMRA